jgi:DNA-binding MarR family transcriptional regulator
MISQGATLALLLLSGFRQLAGDATAELSRRGFPGITSANEFAMRAIASGAGNASDLGRRLGLSKQAAAKTIAVLEQRGYVARIDDPKDARRMLVSVTPRGLQAMREGEEIMQDLRAAWSAKVGRDDLARLERTLGTLVGPSLVNPSAPGSAEMDTDGVDGQ